MQPHHRERRASARKFLAAVTNDPAAVPPVGTRVLKVDYDTKYDPMADITFEDGRTLSVHLHMTPETPGDSDTEAWQEREMAKLQDEESGKTIPGVAERMAQRIACRHLEKSDPRPLPTANPITEAGPEEIEIEGKVKIKVLNSPGAVVNIRVPDPSRVASRFLRI